MLEEQLSALLTSLVGALPTDSSGSILPQLVVLPQQLPANKADNDAS
jgi:hypothetical protein